MSHTPLLLETYFFTRVHCEANPDYTDEGNRALSRNDLEVDLQLEFLQHKKDPDRYQLALNVAGIRAGEKPLPYTIDFKVVGFFSVNPEFGHHNIEKLVRINGASMLYTAAREQVLMITGRGPWGGFTLPTLNFHHLDVQAASELNQKNDI